MKIMKEKLKKINNQYFINISCYYDNNKNIIHNKIHSFIRSKTQEFKNMNISDKNDDFFNINTDCLIC